MACFSSFPSLHKDRASRESFWQPEAFLSASTDTHHDEDRQDVHYWEHPELEPRSVYVQMCVCVFGGSACFCALFFCEWFLAIDHVRALVDAGKG